MPPYLSELSFSWPLKRLDLDSLGDEDIPSIPYSAPFLSCPTLTHLTSHITIIDNSPSSSSSTRVDPPFPLPSLTHLTFNIWNGNPNYLHRFSQSPLKVLRIDDFSASPAKPFLNLLEQHKSTLRRVEMGIKVVEAEPEIDSDDEPMDDYSDDEDPDGYGDEEEEWTDEEEEETDDGGETIE
ncbi:hypothetical protein JCM8547_002834 [Rhodosporidiobolus lusitaniae]